jgi:glycosyltransferase involved in cell wall biosynthesis
LIVLYELSDILLLPSLQDNFPNTILESFAFGTPVVSFDIGGIKDLVSRETGYLADYRSLHDLLVGVQFVRENLEELSKNILSINHNYSYKNVANQFEKIYKYLL